MYSGMTALLLHNRAEPLSSLKVALKKQHIDSVHARSCAEALRILGDYNPPQIVFTDMTVSDEAWGDALLLARKSPVPVSLIVVSNVPDLALCQAAIGCGALALIIPPLPENKLRTLLQRACEDTARRRGIEALAKTA
jgi:DNA-binding NtrC family response regulator